MTVVNLRCQQCGKPKKIPAKVRYARRVDYEADPFCSRVCCEKAHGLEAKA